MTKNQNQDNQSRVAASTLARRNKARKIFELNGRISVHIDVVGY